MNTYALSNCLTPSPELFVYYKSQRRKVNTDTTFLRWQMSVQGNRFCRIDFHKVKLSSTVFFFPPANIQSSQLNEFQGGTNDM